MNMASSNKTVLLATLALCLWSGVELLTDALRQKPDVEATASSQEAFVQKYSSVASALFQLAGERFAANEKRGSVWIMALHQAAKSFGVLKYTDGRITVVVLPCLLPADEPGLRRYVDFYNSYNVKAADLKVKAGEYKAARNLYRLILHFNPQGALAESIQRRLVLVEKIEKGEERERHMKEFEELFIDLAPSFLTGLEELRSTPVTNLFQVTLD